MSRQVAPRTPGALCTTGLTRHPNGKQAAGKHLPQQLVKEPSRPSSSVFVKGICKYLSTISVCVYFHPGLREDEEKIR